MRTGLEKKVIGTVAALACVVLLILLAIIYPTAKQILAINIETKQLLQNIEIRYQNARNIRKNMERTENIKEDVAGFNQYIFQRDDSLSLITMLEAIAEKNNVEQKIENSNFDDIKAKYVSFNLTIKGSYADAFGYLTDIENSRYFININAVNLTAVPRARGADVKSGEEINMRLNINLYASR